MSKDGKVTRIPGTDTAAPPDSEWSDENRETAYRLADLLSLLSGKKVTPVFLVRDKDGSLKDEGSN